MTGNRAKDVASQHVRHVGTWVCLTEAVNAGNRTRSKFTVENNQVRFIVWQIKTHRKTNTRLRDESVAKLSAAEYTIR